MSLLDAIRRGWWSGWAEFPELVAGGAGLVESIIPGDAPDDPLERLKDWGNQAARGLRLEGGGGTSEGLLEKITEGLGAAPGQLSALAPFMLGAGAAIPAGAAGAAIATPALAFGAHGLIRHGDEGLASAVGHGLRGAAEGAAFGGIGKIAGRIGSGLAPEARDLLMMQLKRKAAHAAGVGGLVGGMTGLHGGTLEESVAAGTTMGLLGMISSGKYKDPTLSMAEKVGKVAPEILEYDRTRPLPDLAERTVVGRQAGGLGSAEAAGLRAKPPGSPLRVPRDRTEFKSMPREQQEAFTRQYVEQGGEYRKYSYGEMESATRKGALDADGNQTVKIDPYMVFDYAKRHFELEKEIDTAASRLRRAAAAEDAVEVNMRKNHLDALYAERLAQDLPYGGVKSVAGAALNAIKLAKRNSPEWYKAVELWQKKLGTKMSEEVIDLARMSEGSPELLSRLGRAIDTPKLFDYFQEYWINGLLSGYPTQMVNTLSNALRGSIDVVEKGVALKMEARKGIISKAQARGEIMADIHAGMNSMWTAAKVFAKMLNEEYDLPKEYPQYAAHRLRSKLDYDTRVIPGKVGKVIRFPGAALQAMDIAFKIIAGDRYAASTAYRMASKMVKDGEIKPEQFEAKINELRGLGGNDPHPEILKAMKTNAQRLTFTEPLSRAGQTALKLRDQELFGVRPGVMVLPFVSTPWNVIKQSVARSPLGILRMKSLKVKYDNKEITPHEYYREVAATTMGTAITVGLVGLAKAGFVTGGGPVNQQDRQNLLATGWRPYSIKVGDAYFQMQRLEPFGTILGMAGDIAELGDSEDKLGKMIATIKDNVTDKSFLYGLESLAKAFSNPEQFGSTYYKQVSGSLVPTFFAKAAQAVDPYMRQVEPLGATVGVPDAMAYRIPGLSQALPQRTTAFGELVERWGTLGVDSPLQRIVGGAQSLVSAVPVSAEREDRAVEKEFNRLRAYPGMPPSAPKRTKRIVLRGVHGENVELTNEERQVYDRYHQKAKQHLSRVINSTRWASVPDPLKAKMLKKVYDRYRSAANKEINLMIRRRTTVGN